MSEGIEHHRDVTAFFATRRAADRASENLRNAGFGGDRVKVEEGPRAGGAGQGYVVRVAVMGDEYERVTDILDDENTLSMDETEAGSMSERVHGAAASVRQSIGSGAEKLRQGAERLTHSSPDELAAQARQAASGASSAVSDYVRANPLMALSIAFGVGMLFGLRRR